MNAIENEQIYTRGFGLFQIKETGKQSLLGVMPHGQGDKYDYYLVAKLTVSQ